MDSAPNNLDVAVVAALLHDIGLIAQRAADPTAPATDHAPLAGVFAAERLPAALRTASSVILGHHRPDDRLSRIVAAADRLAAGRDDDEDPSRPMLQRVSPLASALGGRSIAFADLAVLSHDPDAIAPRTAPLDRDEIRKRLGSLAETFATEHTFAASSDVQTYLSTLSDLIDRVGWNVPAPGRDATTDIALADHLRTAAVLAGCLAADESSDDYLGGVLRGDAEALDRPVVLLVRGDLRGDLIATSPDGIAGLRGAAFATDLLAGAIADWLLRHAGVSSLHRLYVGNHGFGVILPLTAAGTIDQLANDVTSRLLRATDGDLVMTFGWATASGTEIGQGIGPAFARLNAESIDRTGRELAGLSVSEQARIFQPRAAGLGCQGCGRDASGQFCQRCGEVHGFGRTLANAVAILHVDGDDVPPESNSIAAALAAFGRRSTLLTAATGLVDLPTGATRARLERFGPPSPPDPAVRSWRDRQPAPVAIVSGARARSWPAESAPPGAPIGVLRADVDSFTTVLGIDGESSPSLARWIGLLGVTRQFLAGSLDAMLARFAPDAAVIAAGGDEFAIAGRLESLPELAHRISLAFRAYAALNPAIHLSAAVVPASRSIVAAYREAGTALQRQAKARKGKDALAFFDQTVSWNDYQAVYTTYRRFVDLIERRGVGRGLLLPFLAADAQAAQAGDSRPAYGPWLWRIAQQLRTVSGLPDADLNNFLGDLRRPDGLARIAIAARWASLTTRIPEESR